MSTSLSVQPASRPVSSSSVASSANTAEQGSELFRTASNLQGGNTLGSSSTPQSGGDQTRAAAAAKETGDDMINASNTLEKAKQDVATAQGMNELFTQWVTRLWMG
jgi:hypothetical protein